MAKRPTGAFRALVAARSRKAAQPQSDLPLPPSWDSSPQLDLGPAPKTKLKRKPPLKLTNEVPKPLERVTHRSILKHINGYLRHGGAFHIPNEGLVGMLPEHLQNKYLNALEADGALWGNTDLFAVWKMPEHWRDILQAGGIDLPQHVALCAGIEVKREGWKPDAEWRKGRQPKAHIWLRAKGVPVKIVRSVVEAHEFLEDIQAPMRVKLLRGAPRPGTEDTAQAGRKKRPARRGSAVVPVTPTANTRKVRINGSTRAR